MPQSTSSSKYLLRELSLIRLYTVLLLSFCYFIGQMVIAHIAHSLILQVDAYHMLYNILALCTSIVTAKMCRKGSNLKNTFGWTRIDVCGAVASLCFLAALCFSVVVEALQAMFHSSHHEKMSHPILVGAVGVVGFAVNAAACFIIGGYTHHERGFLGSHKDGQDIVISPSARRGATDPKLSCGGPLDLFRDFFGCGFVVICSVVLYFWTDDLVDFVDPCVTILEVCILAMLSYKYAKEAGYILLLTIPDDIDVDSLLEELSQSFPEIYDIHEFHIWQLNPSRTIATCHVVLQNTNDCWVVQNNIIDFLQSKGISQVTLQPEFVELEGDNVGAVMSPETLKRRQCFLPCKETEECHEKKCCLPEDEGHDNVSGHSHGHGHSHSHGQDHGFLRSRSLQHISVGDTTATVERLPQRQSNKSNPELMTEKKTAFESTEIQFENRKPPPTTSSHEDDSSEDEALQESKPMI